jgi:hypothetical protein
LIDPCGKKVGEANATTTTVTIDDNHIERFINLWDHWTITTTTREDAIVAISPYVASKLEDTYLRLLLTVLESLPDELDDVDTHMETWKGKYVEMFVMLDNHIRDSERDKALLLQNTPMVTDNDDLSTSLSITGPPLQITGGSPPAVIGMDTREKSAKRSREDPVLTRAQSKANVSELGN